MLSNLLARRARRRIRGVMRGYRILRESNRLGLWSRLRYALTDTPLRSIDSTGASDRIFGAAVRDAERIVRQYLLVRVMGQVGLNESLLYSIGTGNSSIVYHMPREWRDVLRQHGFQVAERRSAVAWHGYVALLFAYGVLSSARKLLRSLAAAGFSPEHRGARFVFFERLSPANLPQPTSDGRSHDVITWYLQWPGRVKDLDAIHHSVEGAEPRTVGGTPVRSVHSAVPYLTDLAAIRRFLAWSIPAILLAFADLLRGRWWHPLLLREASVAAMTRIHHPDTLAREYLFHNTNAIYRPLWTYEVEVKGLLVSFYFYSTNNEPFKRHNGYPVQTGSWQTMSWPRYLVWDEYQADFVRRAIGEASIRVAGPIWFQCSSKELPGLPGNSVAVFDVQPHRASRYRTLGLPDEYYTPRVANQFLRDIVSVAAEFGSPITLKRKRQIGRLLHRSYATVVAQLSERGECVLVDPDINAVRLIEASAAVISMPFTSPALLAQHVGKPSIYYDPLGFVQKDDRAAHGVPVISGMSELRRWFQQLENTETKGSS